MENHHSNPLTQICVCHESERGGQWLDKHASSPLLYNMRVLQQPGNHLEPGTFSPDWQSHQGSSSSIYTSACTLTQFQSCYISTHHNPPPLEEQLRFPVHASVVHCATKQVGHLSFLVNGLMLCTNSCI